MFIFLVSSATDGAYRLLVDGQILEVFCLMDTSHQCGGGWTLVMKIDGTKVIHAILTNIQQFSVLSTHPLAGYIFTLNLQNNEQRRTLEK